MRAAAAALVVAVVLGVATADAHQQGISYSDVELVDGQARVDLVLSTHDIGGDVDGDGVLRDDEVLGRYPQLRRAFARAIVVEAGGTPCPLTLQDHAFQPNEGVLFRLRGPCPTAFPVHVVIRLTMLTSADGYNLGKIRAGGRLVEHVFTRTDAEVVVGEASGGVAAAFGRFFVLGVEHIATGYDHILFLLALLIVGGGLRSLVAIVTAFTVAHSVTLSLAVLDVVQLPARLVESAIALSIAWVALENLVIEQVRGRWRITFAFGLMHGFGFASILRAMQLPREGLVASLLAFNLGVEAGQLIVVVLTYPIVRLIERSPHRRLLVSIASAGILVMALWWFGERAFG